MSRSTSARPAAGSWSPGWARPRWSWSRRTASPTCRPACRTGCTGTCCGCTGTCSTGWPSPPGTANRSPASAWIPGASTTGCSTRLERCSATPTTTATAAPRASPTRSTRASRMRSCTRSPACSSCPSTRCTCSLVGVELEHPVRTPESRQANFPNEVGVDGRIRYLRNVMGLWLLQESLRVWARAGLPADLPSLLGAAGALPAGGPVVDPDDPAFLPPGDMPARIRAACQATGQPVPGGQAELVRCILDSLASAYARVLRDAERLSGRRVEVVHLVGGGARNRLLCELTADACGLPVLAGPVEATALGNVLVQARAHGSLHGDLDSMRALVRATQDIRRHDPAARGQRQGEPR